MPSGSLASIYGWTNCLNISFWCACPLIVIFLFEKNEDVFVNAQNQCNRMKLWSTERKSIESFWKYCHWMNYNYFFISLSLSYEKQLLEWIQITQPLLFSSTPAGHNISIISALTQTHKKIHTHSWWCYSSFDLFMAK